MSLLLLIEVLQVFRIFFLNHACSNSLLSKVNEVGRAPAAAKGLLGK